MIFTLVVSTSCGQLLLEEFQGMYKICLMFDWLKVMCHPDGEISFFNDAAFKVSPSLSEIESYIERIKNIDFKLCFSEPIKFDDELSLEQITLQLNKILEKMILKNPSQWIWSHDRWK